MRKFNILIDYERLALMISLGFFMGMFGLAGTIHMDCINDYQGVTQLSCETVKKNGMFFFVVIMLFFSSLGFYTLYHYGTSDKTKIETKYSKQPVQDRGKRDE